MVRNLDGRILVVNRYSGNALSGNIMSEYCLMSDLLRPTNLSC